jgi:transcriptional activator of cad operon
LTSQLKTVRRIVHLHQQTLVYNTTTVKIRPKTFALLQLFLQHPFEVLSKQMLLDTIWDDVEANEQVLFQTVRELRLLFDGEEVIKTHPRKGYAWIAEVEEYSAVAKLDKSSVNKLAENKQRKVFLWQLLTAMVIFITLTAYYTLNNSPSKNALSGSLVILPMKSVIEDNDHQWVYLGAMNQLISRLQTNDNLVVLNTRFVLTVMEEARLKRVYETKNVRRVFDVSGASLVVETELAGSTLNYQLKYILHFKQDIKRGIIFERNINEAIIKLAKVIVSYSGHSLVELDEAFRSEFSHELLVRAIELKEKNEDLAASKLLESLVLIEPKTLLLKASALAVSTDSNESPIVYYSLALVAFIQGDLSNALSLLKTADEYAIDKHDWLYRAYIAQLKSSIEIKQNKLTQAQISLNNALSYHGVSWYEYYLNTIKRPS